LHAEISREVSFQREALAEIRRSSPGPDLQGLWRQVRREVAQSSEVRGPTWRWGWEPVAIGSVAVLALAVFLGSRYFREPPAAIRSAETLTHAGGVQNGAEEVPAPPRVAAVESDKEDARSGRGRSVAQREETSSTLAAKQPVPPARTAEGELPAELVANPELFVDYDMIVRLDALENFDSVRAPREQGSPGAQQAG